MGSSADLGTAQYLLLTTFRKDGRPVPTPLWVVPHDDGIAVWTSAQSGKVKRIRRDGHVTVAPCTVRGAPTGEAIQATARIGDRADSDRIRAAIIRKYGLLGRLTLWGSRLRRGTDGTVTVIISTEPQSR